MKIDEARDALEVALEGGPWPRRDLIALVAAACGCDPSTVKAAARELGVHSVRRVYWIRHENLESKLSFYIEGFSRAQLIRHLVCGQEPRAATSDCAQEAHTDDLHDLMGADFVWESEES